MPATRFATLTALNNRLVQHGYAPMTAEQIELLEEPTGETFYMLDDWEARLKVDVSDMRGECAAYINARETADHIGPILERLADRHDETDPAANVRYLMGELEAYFMDLSHEAGLRADQNAALEFNRIAEIMGNTWEALKN